MLCQSQKKNLRFPKPRMAGEFFGTFHIPCTRVLYTLCCISINAPSYEIPAVPVSHPLVLRQENASQSHPLNHVWLLQSYWLQLKTQNPFYRLPSLLPAIYAYTLVILYKLVRLSRSQNLGIGGRGHSKKYRPSTSELVQNYNLTSQS